MKTKLVAIGTCGIDEYYEMSDLPIMGDKVILENMGSVVGGMIGNAASVFSNYGNSTVMFDVVDFDETGKQIIDDLKKYNVNTEYINVEKLEQSSKCFIMLHKGERIIFVQENSSVNVHLTEAQNEVLRKTQFIYSTVKDLKRYQKIYDILEEVRNFGVKLVLDIEPNTIKNMSEDIKLIELADHLFINEFGHEYMKRNIQENYADKLLSLNAKTIVITKGEKGCEVLSRDEIISVDGIRVAAKDTTGAGDTFNSSFVHGLSKGWENLKCAQFANAAAAKSVQYVGAKSGVTSEEEVWEFYYKENKNENN